MQSDVASYKLPRTNSIGRPDGYGQQISYRFGIKANMHGQSNEHLVITRSTVKDF